MNLLPLHTNPFDLSAHLEDDHEMTRWVLEQMDSDQLRRTHRAIHMRSRTDHMHFVPEPGD